MNFLSETSLIISAILLGIFTCILIVKNDDLRFENEALKETMLKGEFELINRNSDLVIQNKRLKQALHNAIKECCYGVRGSDACNDLDTLYEAFEKKVWENVN